MRCQFEQLQLMQQEMRSQMQSQAQENERQRRAAAEDRNRHREALEQQARQHQATQQMMQEELAVARQKATGETDVVTSRRAESWIVDGNLAAHFSYHKNEYFYVFKTLDR